MKSIFKSKVIWFNLLTMLTVLASFFGYVPDREVADTTAALLLGLNPLVNLVLRFFTSRKLTI